MTVTSMLSPLSLTQFFYESGELVRTARLFFYHPSTLDPITVYQDAGLGVPHDNPISTGGKGRCPPVYVGTEPYRVRVYDVHGALIEEIPLLEGATAPSGSIPGSVLTPDEQQQLLKTGDMITQFANGAARSGFVRANGMLLAAPGFAGVGYNIERQSADVEFLFKWLWGQSTNTLLPVIGGRGANSTDDWTANKAITLPDMRGRYLANIDSVGGSTGSAEGNILAGVGFEAGGSDNLAGSKFGAAGYALSLAHMPAHSHTISTNSSGVTLIPPSPAVVPSSMASIVSTGPLSIPLTYTTLQLNDPGHTHTVGSAGSGSVFQVVPPTMLVSVYIKL
jgi:microcystin-dependent protein